MGVVGSVLVRTKNAAQATSRASKIGLTGSMPGYAAKPQQHRHLWVLKIRPTSLDSPNWAGGPILPWTSKGRPPGFDSDLPDRVGNLV